MPWCSVLPSMPSHTASADRCTYSVGYGICSRPGATGTGPVRRGASTKKQDKSPGADGESNSSGREEGHMPLKEKKIMPVAMGRHHGTGAIPPAVTDRVLLRHGTGNVAAPEPKAPAGSAGCTEQDDGCLRGGLPHMERSSSRLWKPGAAFEQRVGGGEGTGGNYPGTKDRDAGPPAVVTLMSLDNFA